MAYFWGMYVNGIAVYGRDPLLTCSYAHFVAEDQGCPTTFDHPVPLEMETVSTTILDVVLATFHGKLPGDGNLQPSDWRNCSSKGYHP
eukprot:CAMPEP_0178780934 /NCGR_PEP_ID=MMETSP0745-20121128/2334_1 /TAXON_ID=913974 /ORGANISM="Nitzschia punctata, Strain CCMP561" /LENGTH=87 /DNA_ID=CAMNT_0020438247 /DNA_START=42 /DNA_END=305 /DNA_ORIENTATION=+